MSAFGGGNQFSNLGSFAQRRPATSFSQSDLLNMFPNMNRSQRKFMGQPLAGLGGFVDMPAQPGAGETRFRGAIVPQSFLTEGQASPLERLLSQAGAGGQALFGAVEQDRARLQQSLDDRFNRRNDVLDRFETSFMGGADAIQETADMQAAALREFGDAQQSSFDAERTRIEGDFTDASAQLSANMALAVSRQATAARRSIVDNPNLQPEERQMALSQLQQQTREQVTQGVSQIGADYIQQRASLQTALSGQQVNLNQITAGLQTQAAQLKSAGTLAATQLRVGGFETLAGLIEASPVVSMATGIAQLVALAESGQVPDFGGIGGGAVTGNPNNNQGFNMGFGGGSFGVTETPQSRANRGTTSRRTSRGRGPVDENGIPSGESGPPGLDLLTGGIS